MNPTRSSRRRKGTIRVSMAGKSLSSSSTEAAEGEIQKPGEAKNKDGAEGTAKPAPGARAPVIPANGGLGVSRGTF